MKSTWYDFSDQAGSIYLYHWKWLRAQWLRNFCTGGNKNVCERVLGRRMLKYWKYFSFGRLESPNSLRSQNAFCCFWAKNDSGCVRVNPCFFFSTTIAEILAVPIRNKQKFEPEEAFIVLSCEVSGILFPLFVVVHQTGNFRQRIHKHWNNEDGWLMSWCPLEQGCSQCSPHWRRKMTNVGRKWKKKESSKALSSEKTEKEQSTN